MIALLIVAVVAALGAAFLQVTSSFTRRQVGELDTLRAFYTAEAGLAEAFHAVRIGRSGAIGSEAAPARVGEALVWVDAVETTDRQVRLTSHALSGSGRASLSLVAEPIELPLGFFSEEDLTIDSVLLVDGYDSEGGGYVPPPSGGTVKINKDYPYLWIDDANGILFFEETFYRFQERDGRKYTYDQSITVEGLAGIDALDAYDIQADDFTGGDDDDDDDNDFHDVEYAGVLAYFDSLPEPEPGAPGSPDAPPGGDGLLGSNGDIRFTTPDGEVVEVFGDVVPGPSGSVQLGDAIVTGSTESRADTVELPDVVVPSVGMAPPVYHDSPVPLLLPPGTNGFDAIDVAPDSEFVVRGPSVVVIGSLTLQPGASLVFDTRDGDVSLFVLGAFDLQDGAVVSNTNDSPDETSIQVGDEEATVVNLDASGQFHGTLYAPSREVSIGSDFEVFGSVVARRLNIGAGTKLHFDNAEASGSPIPRVVGWKIVELPSAVRSNLMDAHRVLNVSRDDLDPLAEAHDLAAVSLSIEWLSHSGVRGTYSGTEDGFDWSRVGEVVKIDRIANRPREDGDEPPPDETPPDEPALEPGRPEVIDAIANLSGGDLKSYLESVAPLSDSELIAAIDAMNMVSGDTKSVLTCCDALSEAVLERLLTGSTTLFSGDMKTALEHSSPLPPHIVDLVNAAPDSVLSPGDKSAVMDKQ